MILYKKNYWRLNSETGMLWELEFTQVQVSDRGWVVGLNGLSLIEAATLVDEWNRMGNKNGYHYYLHKPEVN